MYSLTLFEVFLITHLAMDWIFQWKWEATNKAKNLFALFFHCAVYTAGFIPAFLYFEINLTWLILIFISHAVIDNRKLLFFILEKFKGRKREGVSEAEWLVLITGVDQTLHLVVLALIVIFS